MSWLRSALVPHHGGPVRRPAGPPHNRPAHRCRRPRHRESRSRPPGRRDSGSPSGDSGEPKSRSRCFHKRRSPPACERRRSSLPRGNHLGWHRPGADLGALLALARDHERRPTLPVDQPHALVDGARQTHHLINAQRLIVTPTQRSVTALAAFGFDLLRFRGHGQIWMARPSTASAASLTDSETVGCGWILAPISHGVDSSNLASAVSEINSVALGPMMKTPSRSPESASLMILTKPSVSPRITDLALPTSGNLPTLTFSPWSLACFSDNPRLATCG